MTMRFKPLSRRTLLRGAGGLAFSLPLLEAMNVSAQTAAPKRLILFYQPVGFSIGAGGGTFWPSGTTETNFTFGASLAPLNAFKSQMLVLQGLDLKAALDPYRVVMNSHIDGMSALWCGAQTTGTGLSASASVDQVIGRAQTTKFKTYQFGVDGDGNGSDAMCRTIFTGRDQGVLPVNSPTQAFSNLFSNFTPPSSGGGTTSAPAVDPAVVQLQKDRRSVLDSVTTQIAELKPKVSGDDWQKLNAHFESVRNIEVRLAEVPDGGTVSPPATTAAACAKPTVGSGSDFPTVSNLQIDLLVAGLACDLFRVCSLQHGFSNEERTYTWAGCSQRHHDPGTHSHIFSELTKVDAWYSGQISRLLTKLQSIKEGSGTMLDNTLLVWSSNLGDGGDHQRVNVPFVLAGGGAGFRMGRYVRYPKGTYANNDLLVSILRAFGQNVSTFGLGAVCKGPLPGLV